MPPTALPSDDRRLAVEERRLRLDSSFAKKWLPTLVTIMAGLTASLFGYVQQQSNLQATERARIDAAAREAVARTEASQRDEREWGFKVVEMYFDKRDLFDMAKNPPAAEANLKVLAAVAPAAVRGVLDAEQTRIAAPGTGNDQQRLESLAADGDRERPPGVSAAGAGANPGHPSGPRVPSVRLYCLHSVPGGRQSPGGEGPGRSQQPRLSRPRP